MNRHIVSQMVLGWPLTAEAIPAGRDWLICVTGGCAPHVGSVSTGRWTEAGAEVETICLPSHRDDVISELFARELAASLRTTVCVTCGIHYDGIDRAGIEAVVSQANALAKELAERCAALA